MRFCNLFTSIGQLIGLQSYLQEKRYIRSCFFFERKRLNSKKLFLLLPSLVFFSCISHCDYITVLLIIRQNSQQSPNLSKGISSILHILILAIQKTEDTRKGISLFIAVHYLWKEWIQQQKHDEIIYKTIILIANFVGYLPNMFYFLHLVSVSTINF